MTHHTGPDADPPEWAALHRVEMVADFLVDIERAEIEMPHIVVCRHGSTGQVSFSGPYEHVVAALRAAELEQASGVLSGEDERASFEVAALYPPFHP